MTARGGPGRLVGRFAGVSHLRRRRALLALAPLTLAALGGPLAAAADEASKPPKRILADVARDLAKVRSYHFAGTQTDADGVMRLSGDVTAGGTARLKASQGGQSFEVRILGSRTFYNANLAFWKSAVGGSGGDALATTLAGRWVKVPASLGGGKDLLQGLRPKDLAYCATHGLGTVRKAGTATVGGRRAIVLVDKGDKPGTSPGRVYVAARGAILPLRLVQTGRTRPGGHLDPRCSDPGDTTKSSSIRLGAYGVKVRVTAPAGALDLGQLQDGGGGGSPA
jgi:hypothetical protein